MLHLCSAQVIKSVSFTLKKKKKTADEGLKKLVTYVFARLQNSVSEEALAIFRYLCMVLLAKHASKSVPKSLTFLENLIMDKDATVEHIFEDEVQDKWEIDKTTLKTIVGCSPFTKVFMKVNSDVISVLKEAKWQHSDDNPYYCPDMIGYLMDNYMDIYPLWSGDLLGNLKIYFSDKAEALSSPPNSNTRDTNCHDEKWFGIEKLPYFPNTNISGQQSSLGLCMDL